MKYTHIYEKVIKIHFIKDTKKIKIDFYNKLNYKITFLCFIIYQ